VRFSFTEDQLALRDAVRDLLAKECPPEVVRAAWPEPDADGQGPGAGARSTPEQLAAVWSHLAEMGVLGLLVPESNGGLGFDEVAAALVLEETGYVAVPHPVVEAVCVTAPVLGDPAPDRSQVGWGEVAMTGAVVDRSVDLRGPGVEADALAFDRAALGTAAQLVGLSRRMLDLTVAYVIERRQFGVPIGSFQAVKHHLADARLQLEFAAPAVYRAAWSLATNDPNAARDVSMAKALASDCAHLVGRKALQCHGGIGYTVEYDLHLFLKRAWALEKLWGDAAWHRDRVGRALGV
jgi:alkylation response protein AidB-like acyl-CoA dehydrogenase